MFVLYIVFWIFNNNGLLLVLGFFVWFKIVIVLIDCGIFLRNVLIGNGW